MAAFLVAVTASPLPAAETADAADERLIRAEDGVGRAVLAAPYTLFSLTGWPLKWTMNWMEEAAIPARVRDSALYPLRFFDDDDEDEEEKDD